MKNVFNFNNMFKKEKYYGEVWFPEDETVKCFCVLTFKDNTVLLETNLVTIYPRNKYPKILGMFTGLGYLTFLDCEMILSSSGIINCAIYKPKYTFTFGEHIIDPLTLKIKKFSVSNNALNNWKRPNYNFDRVNKTLVFNQEELHPLRIEEINLSIEIVYNTSYRAGTEEFILKNNGRIKFNSGSPVKIADAFDIYDKTQKLVQFITGYTGQFTSFNFQCLDCDKWGSVFFQELSYRDIRSVYFTTDFQEIVPELPKLFDHIFCDESFYFCTAKLLDNHVKGQLSNNKRFTNSISCLEGYSKLYSKRKNTKLSGFLKSNKDLILAISKKSENEFDDFISKIISSRDYHVHSNIKNTNIFSDFELLYISFLLDIVIAVNLLIQINISQPILDKIIFQGQSVFNGMQELNRELSHDYLRGQKH